MTRRVLLLLASVPTLLLAGCSANFGSVSDSSQTSLGTIQGSIMGGREAIQGAHIYVFAVGSSGYGGQSVSLLNNVPGTTTADTTTFPGKTIYYVTSGSAASGGAFTITGDYTCPVGDQLYLYATGGSPDAGVHTNSAIGLMAALGTCQSGVSLAVNVPYVTLNEVTTVAAAYALGGFAVDSTDISSSGTTQALTGVQNALANAGNIVTVKDGMARTMTPSGSGTVPYQLIYTIANVLAACVSSTAPSSSNCSTLFGAAVNSSGALPTDTASAAINLVHSPGGTKVGTLYALQTASSPYTGFGGAPNDFSIAVQYNGVSGATDVAVDSAGDAWVTDATGNSLSELTPLGLISSGFGPPEIISKPIGIAIDPSGYIWVANSGNNTLAKFTPIGGLISGLGFTGGLNNPQGIASDASGNIWVANKGNSSISEFVTAGTPATGSPFTGSGQYQTTALAIDGAGDAWTPALSGKLVELGPTGTALSGTSGFTASVGINTIAIDGTGNVWVTSEASDSLAEFTHAGAPATGSPFSGGGIDTGAGIAIDGAGAVWIANNGGNSISHFTSAGVAVSSSPGYQGGNMIQPEGIAIDPSGNVWVAANGSNSVAQFLGMAAPVITPIAAGLPATPNATGASSMGTRP